MEKKKSLQEQLLKKIKDKEAVVGVIGLGYVGLPLAVEKAKAGYKTIGFDIQSKKVKMVNRGENYIGDIIAGDLKKVVKNGRLRATNDLSFLKEVDCILICVPTPLDDYSQPDTSYLRKTGENIAKYIQKGVLVILESTTYPGTTENFLRPILEKSGLKAGEDFFLVFSPERVDPGNKFYNIKNTPKVVGGINQESSDLAKELYQNIIEEKVYQVSSPAVAEMEKILENTYRYVNIALVNEMAILANEMGLDIWEVIEAASTKPYGYKAFYPGPGVGGHCIPIDPFYLSWLAKQFKFRTKFIELAADINMQMPKYILERINDLLNREGKQLKDSKILQLGLAYKQDIDDIRSSPGIELFKLLKKKGVILEYNDPFINEFKIDEQCYQSMVLGKEVLESVDLVFITCKHSSYDYNFIQKHAKLIFDTRNAMKGLKNKENVELL
ncbi:nucleotide sugar dehydrogenase [Natronospora cellulosivora (SeqCode)]